MTSEYKELKGSVDFVIPYIEKFPHERHGLLWRHFPRRCSVCLIIGVLLGEQTPKGDDGRGLFLRSLKCKAPSY